MGRKQAEKTLNLEEEIKRLDDQGILHAIRGKEIWMKPWSIQRY